jgi:hypothetical protein
MDARSMARVRALAIGLVASRSESNGDAHFDTAIGSGGVNRQPGARANRTSDRCKTKCVRYAARAALFLVRVTKGCGKGAECRNADHSANDCTIRERIARNVIVSDS